MSTSKNAESVKAKNYTEQQEAQIVSMGSVSFDQCNQLAAEWGKSPASIRAKVLSLGVEYIPKPKASKKVSKGDTKAELVSKIETALDAKDMLGGLEKATAATLVNLLGCAKVALRAKANGSS